MFSSVNETWEGTIDFYKRRAISLIYLLGEYWLLKNTPSACYQFLCYLQRFIYSCLSNGLFVTKVFVVAVNDTQPDKNGEE
jgi:hypothetical protein